MIPILPEIQAAPAKAASAIAPNLLVTMADFPALLEESQNLSATFETEERPPEGALADFAQLDVNISAETARPGVALPITGNTLPKVDEGAVHEADTVEVAAPESRPVFRPSERTIPAEIALQADRLVRIRQDAPPVNRPDVAVKVEHPAIQVVEAKVIDDHPKKEARPTPAFPVTAPVKTEAPALRSEPDAALCHPDDDTDRASLAPQRPERETGLERAHARLVDLPAVAAGNARIEIARAQALPLREPVPVLIEPSKSTVTPQPEALAQPRPKIVSQGSNETIDQSPARAAISELSQSVGSGSAAQGSQSQSAQSQIANAAPTIASAPSVDPKAEPRIDARLGAQVETAIDQLTETRQGVREARPELNLRHHEFGAINLRLDASGADLRATLSSRDPGFVPAIQAALADRAIIAASESSAGQSHRGNEQSQAQSQGNSQGAGGHSEGRYGSSTGSGQASSQPYLRQDGPNDEEQPLRMSAGSSEPGNDASRSGGLFA